MLLETNPDNLTENMSSAEKSRRFGSPTDQNKLNAYKSFCMQKLKEVCKTLITSIKRALPAFPPAISWIISRIYSSAKDLAGMEEDEAFQICYELLMSNVMSPVLVSPEKYGITGDNIQITKMQRHNLQKISQILQRLLGPETFLDDTLKELKSSLQVDSLKTHIKMMR